MLPLCLNDIIRISVAIKISAQIQTLLYRTYLSLFFLATLITACLAVPIIYESILGIESYDSNNYSQALNVKTKTIENSLTPKELKDGFLKGALALNGIKPVLMIDPDSRELYEFNSTKAQEALGRGLEFATEQQALASIEAANTSRKSRAIEGILFLVGIPLGIFLLKKWMVWLFGSFLSKEEVGG